MLMPATKNAGLAGIIKRQKNIDRRVNTKEGGSKGKFWKVQEGGIQKKVPGQTKRRHGQAVRSAAAAKWQPPGRGMHLVPAARVAGSRC